MREHNGFHAHPTWGHPLDVIRLQGLVFYGYHGVFPEEKKLGQRFVVDLELYADLRKPAVTDDLADAVNYVDVYNLVKRCVTGKQFNLIETLAEDIAREVLDNTACQGVKVVLHKPGAPIGGITGDVAVEIVRMRQRRDEEGQAFK